jgi:hypothetical protein
MRAADPSYALLRPRDISISSRVTAGVPERVDETLRTVLRREGAVHGLYGKDGIDVETYRIPAAPSS